MSSLSTEPVAVFIAGLLSVFDSPTVPPSVPLVKRAAKIAAGGLPTRKKTTNVRESQIVGGENVRKTLVMDVRHHQKRCEASCATPPKKKKKTNKLPHSIHF